MGWFSSERLRAWFGEKFGSMRTPDVGERAALSLGTPRAWLAGLGLLLLGWGLYTLITQPPLAGIGPGEIGVRVNQLTGTATEIGEGSVLVLPGVHRLRRLSLREQVYRPISSQSASGEAPLQSVEGLSLGVDLTVRYILERARVAAAAATLPEDIGGEIVEPRVHGVIYKAFARYTVREIFSTKRAEIAQLIEKELAPLLAADGLTLRAVTLGKIDLPPEYRAGLERLLAEELATEKMRYTLELKDKQVKQSELEASAEKVRREKAAEAAGNEQVIAARAQAEAMKHVLPFKQRQIEQRKLEAEAERVSRLKQAQTNAEARKIEAGGEADSRRKLAEAEAYRLDVVGKANSEQLARDGAVISQHPLLIQKTMADKLSDKVAVIIAPPATDGALITQSLLGAQRPAKPTP